MPINIDRGCLLYHPAIEDIRDEIEDEGDDGHGDHKTNAMKVKDTSDIYNSIRVSKLRFLSLLERFTI